MKREHCSTFAVPHTSVSITPLSQQQPPVPLLPAAPALCAMEELLRDPLLPGAGAVPAHGRRSSSCRMQISWEQPTELGVPAPAAAGQCPGLCLTPPCSGKVPRQHKGRAGPAQLLLHLHLPIPAGQGSQLLQRRRSIAPGSSPWKERLPSCWLISPILPYPQGQELCSSLGEAGDPAGPCLSWMVDEIPEALQPKALGREWNL